VGCPFGRHKRPRMGPRSATAFTRGRLSRVSLDYDAAIVFISSIPKGCWTTYRDVADAAGNADAPPEDRRVAHAERRVDPVLLASHLLRWRGPGRIHRVDLRSTPERGRGT